MGPWGPVLRAGRVSGCSPKCMRGRGFHCLHSPWFEEPTILGMISVIIYHKGGLIPREGIKLSLASLGGVVQFGLGANCGSFQCP
jgi:hypothetical protein